MGLFSKKKKEKGKGERVASRPEAKREEAGAQEKQEKVLPDTRQVSGEMLYTVLKGPRITEKATDLSEYDTFVFEVRADANKHEVKKAIEALYDVHPVSVRMVQIPRKKVFSRGKVGMTAKSKKAYVKLREGERIELI